ncbi:hypothetical protein [Collinsella ihumii]|uniref:Secreted protein n=1 Tax=Collinsella ihumii TaxID=1720204 RepID=A0ABT7XF01_9ACTN|nr:hypothetical protein [Collinsella ihumii]MDN0063996.1 hypothetical protein [Collinsella ihumii]
MQTLIVTLLATLVALAIALIVLHIRSMQHMKQIEWRLNVIDGRLLSLDPIKNSTSGQQRVSAPRRTSKDVQQSGTQKHKAQATARNGSVAARKHPHVDPRPDAVPSSLPASRSSGIIGYGNSRTDEHGGTPLEFDPSTNSIIIEMVASD